MTYIGKICRIQCISWGQGTEDCHVSVRCGTRGSICQILEYRSTLVFSFVIFRNDFPWFCMFRSGALSTMATNSFSGLFASSHLTIELTIVCLAEVHYWRTCANRTTLRVMVICFETNVVHTFVGAVIIDCVSFALDFYTSGICVMTSDIWTLRPW